MTYGKTGLVAGALLLGALSLSACATKEYVNNAMDPLNAELLATQGELGQTRGELSAAKDVINNHETKITQIDATSREALDRAIAAGKLAEGKFLYSMVMSDDGVKFSSDKFELSPAAQERLEQLVSRLKSENRNVYLEIQGHTDNTGADKYNEKLGEERAEAVRRFLSKEGVALSRMATISYGETAPVAPNSDVDGRAQNRRVVIVVLA